MKTIRNGMRNAVFAALFLLGMSLFAGCAASPTGGKTAGSNASETQEMQVIIPEAEKTDVQPADPSEAEKTDVQPADPSVARETDIQAADPSAAEHLCVLTIDNGASSVNTKYAVNALHVYCPDTEDKEDYFSGDELPAGISICIFAYNTAGDIHMTIVHNGETLCDKDFKRVIPWENDEEVERFTFTLEGDLTVTTYAIQK